ncbi:tetratricopeptide repeat protein [Saccharothrix sp. Mg75]|uniref:AfsR/SARP family transcriptional regulator n=1 Tax=Saccharothrix sp. Mg75 TaxID=3445357 RepID=UPI003EEEDB6D
MDLRVLGPVEIRDGDDRPVALRARLDRMLLAALLIKPNQWVSVRSLISRMWEVDAPPQVKIGDYRRDFGKYRRSLRRALETHGDGAARIESTDEAVVLKVDPDRVDHVRFQRHLDIARREDSSQRVADAARAALTEWRGVALQGLGDNSWVSASREALELQWSNAWQLLISAYLEQGHPQRVLDEISEPLARRPFDKALVEFRMEALHRVGQRGEAVSVYDKFEALLRGSDRGEPGTELRNLRDRIKADDPSLNTPAPLDSRGGVVTLPARPLLVGREAQVEELVLLLEDSDPAPAPVLTGLPGVGKTSLAIHVAHEALKRSRFTDVLFLDLQGYSPFPILPEDTVPALLRQMSVLSDQPAGMRHNYVVLYRETLNRHAQAERRILIVADNAAYTEQVELLLPDSPPHKLLVTSRSILGNSRVNLRPIPVDLPSTEIAIKQLDQHLRRARPGDDRIARSAQDAAKVVTLCGFLPLALYISAARLVEAPALSVKQLAEDLTDAGQRLGTLSRDSTSSVVVAFTLSYDKLQPRTARMFRLLALNPGVQTGSSAAAALSGQPLGETRNLLHELRRAHLLEDGIDYDWWRFHDLIALYARQLVESDDSETERDDAFARLVNEYAAATRAASDRLDAHGAPVAGPNRFSSRREALDWLDIQHSTLAATVDRATEVHDALVLDIAAHLAGYHELRRYSEEWIALGTTALHAAQRTSDRHAQRTAHSNLGRALTDARQFADAVGHYRQAQLIAQEIGDRPGEARVLTDLGDVHRKTRRFDDAIACYRRAMAIRRGVGDRRGEALLWHDLGTTYGQMQRPEESVFCYQQAIRVFRGMGDRHGEGRASHHLGVAHGIMRQAETAVGCLEKALRLYRDLGDRQGEGQGLYELGVVHGQQGHYIEAMKAYVQAVEVLHEVGDRYGEALALRAQGEIHHAQRSPVQARQRWNEALALLVDFSDPEAHARTEEVRRWLNAVQL